MFIAPKEIRRVKKLDSPSKKFEFRQRNFSKFFLQHMQEDTCTFQSLENECSVALFPFLLIFQ